LAGKVNGKVQMAILAIVIIALIMSASTLGYLATSMMGQLESLRKTVSDLSDIVSSLNATMTDVRDIVGAPPPPAPPPRGIITLWTAWGGGEREALTKVLVKFGEKYGAYITVLVEDVPFDVLRSKLITAVPMGVGPDLYTGPHDWVGELVKAGILASVSPKLDAATKAKFVESAMKGVTFAGHPFGLPQSLKMPTLIYNKENITTPPKTTDELFSLMATFKAKGTYALAYDVANAYFSVAWFHGYGAYYLDPDTLKVALNTTGGIKAAQLIADMRPYMPPDIGYDLMMTLFTTKKAAMIINGPWCIADLKKAGFDPATNLGFALLPNVTGGERAKPYMTIEGVHITKNAVERGVFDAAWFFAYWLVTEGILTMAKEAGHVPAYSPAAEDPAVKADPIITAFFNQSMYAVPMPNVPQMGVIWGVVPRYLSAVWTGTMTPEEAMNSAQKEAEEGIAAAG